MQYLLHYMQYLGAMDLRIALPVLMCHGYTYMTMIKLELGFTCATA